MVELSGNIPFLWRLSAETNEGVCMVSMVVPFESESATGGYLSGAAGGSREKAEAGSKTASSTGFGGETGNKVHTEESCSESHQDPRKESRHDLTIETSVVSFPSDSSRAEQEEMLEWNQDDISLFLKLVRHEQPGAASSEADEQMLDGETVRIDLTDPAIIEIIHVVAAAGFGMAFTSYGVLKNSTGRYPPHLCDIGSFASLNTVDGFKRCVVVDIDGEDAVCVLLDEVDVVSVGEYDKLSRHDLLLVKRTDLLHPDFSTTTARPPSATLH